MKYTFKKALSLTIVTCNENVGQESFDFVLRIGEDIIIKVIVMDQLAYDLPKLSADFASHLNGQVK